MEAGRGDESGQVWRHGRSPAVTVRGVGLVQFAAEVAQQAVSIYRSWSLGAAAAHPVDGSLTSVWRLGGVEERAARLEWGWGWVRRKRGRLDLGMALWLGGEGNHRGPISACSDEIKGRIGLA